MKTIVVYVYGGNVNLNSEGYAVYPDVPVNKHSTVLSVLEYIRVHIDRGLVYRRSCHHGVCNTCSIEINGKAQPACLSPIQNSELYLRPLEGLAVRSQLLVELPIKRVT